MKWIVRIVLLGLCIASVIYSFGFGAFFGRFAPETVEDAMARSIRLAMLLPIEFGPCQGQAAMDCGFQDPAGREEVSCAAYSDERTAVLMTFGQSNSANAGQDRYVPITDVANFNIHDGKCYRAEDPLLGPDAEGGSVWGVLGDKLIMGGHYDRVLVVPFGIGGSSIGQWQEDGPFHESLENALNAIEKAEITPTHVLWHQGEADAVSATPEDQYFSMFEQLVAKIRSGGVEAPIYPAVATHCQIPVFDRGPEALQGIEPVRRAQQRLIEIDGVFAGPDTDEIQGPHVRHDNCHFNAKGMQAHAGAWLEAITQ